MPTHEAMILTNVVTHLQERRDAAYGEYDALADKHGIDDNRTKFAARRYTRLAVQVAAIEVAVDAVSAIRAEPEKWDEVIKDALTALESEVA